METQIRRYVAVWALLVLFLAGTYVGAMLPLSATLSVVSNLGFAALKTGLVAWFFMHLNESQPLSRVTAAASLLFLFLMFYLTLVDLLWRA